MQGYRGGDDRRGGGGDRRVRLVAAEDDYGGVRRGAPDGPRNGPPRDGRRDSQRDAYDEAGAGARSRPAGGRDGASGRGRDEREDVGRTAQHRPAAGGGKGQARGAPPLAKRGYEQAASEDEMSGSSAEPVEEARGPARGGHRDAQGKGAAPEPAQRLARKGGEEQLDDRLAGREARRPEGQSRREAPSRDDVAERMDRLVKGAQPSKRQPQPDSPPAAAARSGGGRSAAPLGAPAEPPPRSAVPLSVSGCSNSTISAIVKGNYTPYSANHGKVVYRKDEKSKGFEVLIYYWDDRDGPELCGWWFGPNVGGDQVWAYHPSRSSTSPPSSEWNVPHDGAIDPTFAVTARVDASRRPPAQAAEAPSPRATREPVKERAPEQDRRGHAEPNERRRGTDPAPQQRSRDVREDAYAREAAPAPSPRAPAGRDRSEPYSREAQRERDTPRQVDGAQRHNRQEEPERREPERREPVRHEERRAPEEPSDGGGRVASSSHHQHFVDAYNKRRQAARRDEEREEEEPRELPKERTRDAPRDDAQDRRHMGKAGRREEEPVVRDRERSPVGRGAREDPEPPARGSRGDPEPPARGGRGGDRGDRGAPVEGRVRDDARGDPRRDELRRDEPRRDEPRRDEPRRDEPRRDEAPRREEPRRGEPQKDDRESRREQRDQERRRDEDSRRVTEEKRRADERNRRDEEKRRTEEARERDEERRREAERRHREEAKRRDEERERREKDDEANKGRREEERKKKEEDMKIKDEELQRKREEKRREEKVIQDKLAEERRQEGAKKRKEDMEKAAEAAKIMAAETEKAEEEAKLRRDEEQKALRQQQATLNVLQVLQKLSSATPENFEELKKDLDGALLTELPECGQQQEILKAEADRVLEYARHYVKQVTEQRDGEEKKRLSQEKIAKDLLDELEQLVSAAEESSEGVYYTAAPLSGENDLPDLEVVRISRDVQKLGKSAMAACSSCADFITHKRPIIEEAESIGEESAAIIAVLLPRIRAATRRTAEAFQQGKEHREKVEKRVLASRYVARKESLFTKYDKDSDGYMDLEDVTSYAKGEFNFDIPTENLDKIKRKLFQGDVGVQKDDFQLLKAAVGIARSEAIGRIQRVNRVEREAREKEESAARQMQIDTRKSELQEVLKASAKALSDLEPAIKEAEKVAEALAGAAGQLGSEDLKVQSDAADAQTHDTRDQLDGIRSTIKEIMAEVGEVSELQDFMRGILVPLSSRSDIFEMRLRKAMETAASGRQLAQYMALSEYEGLWTEVVVKLRACIENIEGKTTEDMFDHIAGSDITVPEGTPGSEFDTITSTEIQNFLTTSGCEVELDKLDKLFGRGISGGPKVGAIADSAEDDETGKAEQQGEDESTKKPDDEAMAVDEEKPKDGEPVVEEDAGKKEASDDKIEASEDKKEATDDKKEASDDKQEEGAKGEADSKKEEDKATEGADKKEESEEVNKEESKEGEQTANGDAAKEAEDKVEKMKQGTDEAGKEIVIDIAAEAAKAAAKMSEARQEEAAEKMKSKQGMHVARADFKRIIRMYYKVTRHCVLSDNLQIEQSSQIRRMDVGEVIEVHRGPTLDVSVNVYRVFCKCIRDGINGWATIAGNTGVTFLMPGGRIFTVKIAVPLTSELKDVEGEFLIRTLAEGEVLEVLEWARTSRSALGVTRIRARAQLDNSVGWVTTVGNDEKVYLEAM